MKATFDDFGNAVVDNLGSDRVGHAVGGGSSPHVGGVVQGVYYLGRYLLPSRLTPTRTGDPTGGLVLVQIVELLLHLFHRYWRFASHFGDVPDFECRVCVESSPVEKWPEVTVSIYNSWSHNHPSFHIFSIKTTIVCLLKHRPKLQLPRVKDLKKGRGE